MSENRKTIVAAAAAGGGQTISNTNSKVVVDAYVLLATMWEAIADMKEHEQTAVCKTIGVTADRVKATTNDLRIMVADFPAKTVLASFVSSIEAGEARLPRDFERAALVKALAGSN